MAEKLRHVDSIYGNLAYDFTDTAYLNNDTTYTNQQVVIPAPRVVNEKTRTKVRVVSAQSISPVAIIGFACAAVLLIFMLMSHIQLTEVTNEAVDLENSLSELKTEQNRLLIKYEEAFNLTEVENYAIDQLGMIRPRNDQITYIDSTVPDKAVVISPDDTKKSLGDRIIDALSSLSDYFK